jgi:DNA-directed RNA polymerase subunit RPC12/RpoP
MKLSKWITCFYKREDVIENNILEYKCAECGNYNERATDYCPHCGTKMVGVDRNYVHITFLYGLDIHTFDDDDPEVLWSEENLTMHQDLINLIKEGKCDKEEVFDIALDTFNATCSWFEQHFKGAFNLSDNDADSLAELINEIVNKHDLA